MADVVITNQSKSVVGPGEALSVTFDIANPDVADMDLSIAIDLADGSQITQVVPVTFKNGVVGASIVDVNGKGYTIEETTDPGQHNGWRFRVTAPVTF